MNPYLKHLEKIEFVLTRACTGRCKHCSQGDHPGNAAHLDPRCCADLVRQVAGRFPIRTVMVFGGEPLLFPRAAAQILSAARDAQVPHRQLITNGYFTHSEKALKSTVSLLAESGVNDLLLSVDAFHQETIPLETVRTFALLVKEAGIPLRLQPAWLRSPEDPNPYNEKTRSLLQSFASNGFPVGSGNVIFSEGNATRYLAEYFTDTVPENPYRENARDLRTLSVDSDGTVLGGNLYETDILELIASYDP